jgi:hypothetical protein
MLPALLGCARTRAWQSDIPDLEGRHAVGDTTVCCALHE